MMQNGGGASDTARYLAFLDLPCAAAIGIKGFNLIKSDIGKVLCNLAEAIDDALLEEIRLTLEDKMK
eukprot:5650713-Ditylum_brightwellii.AAC.1